MQAFPQSEKNVSSKLIACALVGMCMLSMPQSLRADGDINAPTGNTLTSYNSTKNLPTLILSDAETGQSLTPYMEYMVDVSGMATLLELFSPSYENAFTPLAQGIPLTDSGSTWLRLSIAPDSDNSHVIALGSELATDVILYVPDFSQYAENMKDSLVNGGSNGTLKGALHADTTKARVATPWQEFTIPHGEAITLPAITDAELLKQLQGLSLPVYIQMAGTPEPWFAPQLRSITDIAHDNSRLIHIGIAMMLTAVLALCLLRAFLEKGQWRLWTTFFTLALLVQSLVGVPTTPHGSIGLAGLPNVLAPAMALMLLPHIARHMLRRTEFSPKYIPANGSQLDADLDQQYRFLSIPCMLIAIVPLLPNMGWLGKLLPLWPLAILLFLPTTAIAVFRKIAGAKLFLFGCLASILGAMCALMAMLMSMPATIINAIPLFGTALCALVLAGANMTHGIAKPMVSQEKNDTKQPTPITIREDYDDPLMGEGLRLVSAAEGLATGIVLDGKVVEDENSVKNNAVTQNNKTDTKPFSTSSALGEVRSVQVITPAEVGEPVNTVETDVAPLAVDDEPVLADNVDHACNTDETLCVEEHTDIINNSTATEEPSSQALSVPTPHVTSAPMTPIVTELPNQSLMASLRDIEQDDMHTLVRAEEAMRYPLENLRKSLDALQKHAQSPDSKTLHQEATTASKQLDLVNEAFRRAAYRLPAESASMIFDLQSCLREAHDNVCEQSDAKNVALSWFMAPHLVQTYQGDANRLRTTLRVLMESAVDATDKGSVYLSARRVPDSTNPGHLLFTITDTGAGGPPERRKASAVMQAWELATSTGGSISIDSGKHGTTISFSTRFLAIHNENAPANILGHRSSALNALNSLEKSEYSTSGKHARILIGAPAASNRQLLAFYLEDTVYYADEAVSNLDIMEKYTSNGAELIILDCDMSELEIAKIITSIRQYEHENDLTPVPFLALVRDEAQADAFLHLGCTQTLLKPVTRSGLCAQVALLAPIVLLPTSIEDGQDVDEQNESTNTHQSALSPTLINATLIEAMELLSAPAKQDITPITPECVDAHTAPAPSVTENQASVAEVTTPEQALPDLAPEFTAPERTLSELETPNMSQAEEACIENTNAQTVAPNEESYLSAQVAPEVTPETTTETTTETAAMAKPETAPKPDAEHTQTSVPTSEAEDITLQIFDEYLQGEKSSVSPSMQALDPILFTDLLAEPAPKRAPKGKGLFGSASQKKPNNPISQPSFIEDKRDSASNEYVSAPRAVSTPVQKPVGEPAPVAPAELVTPVATPVPTPLATPAVAPVVAPVVPAVTSVAAPIIAPVVDSLLDATEEPIATPSVTPETTTTATPAPTLATKDQPEQTQSINVQSTETAPTDHAFVYTDTESEVSAPRPIQSAAPQDIQPIKTPVVVPQQQPTERGNEVYVEEVTVGNEVLRLYKVPTTPVDPDAEYDAMLKREAGHNEPNSTAQQNTISQPWAKVSDITADSHTQADPDCTTVPDFTADSAVNIEPNTTPMASEDVELSTIPVPRVISEQKQKTEVTQPVIETIAEPIFEPVVSPIVAPMVEPIIAPITETTVEPAISPDYVLPNSAESETASYDTILLENPLPELTPPSAADYDADEVSDEANAPSANRNDAPNEAFAQESYEIDDDEYDEDDAESEDETDDDDDQPDTKEPSAVKRATAALFAVCTSLREPAPLRLKEKALPSLRSLRKAFEMANTTSAPQQSENTSGTSTEDQGPRFVSIAQSVTELAATIKPAPSILRNSAHKDFVPQLIAELQNTIDQATTGYEQGDVDTLHASAARIADTAEALGLRALERHTRCVERAAQAGDLSAARELYPDMENVVQRTITALRSSGLNGAHRV